MPLRRISYARAASVALLALSAVAPAIAAGCKQGTDPPATPDASAVSGEFPCEVGRVLVQICQQCHTRPPRNEAPFPLVTYADTQTTMSGRPLYTFMLAALESEHMPLPPAQIDPSDRTILIAWLRAGAAAAPSGQVCTAKDADPPDDGTLALVDSDVPDAGDDANDGGEECDAPIEADDADDADASTD